MTGSCARCSAEDELCAFGKWNLCRICAFDAEQLIGPQVKAGRLPSVLVGVRGYRWQQIKTIIERDGFITSKALRLATGMTCYLARDTIAGYKKRGALRQVEGQYGRYEIVPEHESQRGKAHNGERWRQVSILIKKHGFATCHQYAKEFGISYNLAKGVLSDLKIQGELVKDDQHRYFLKEQHGRVELPPANEAIAKTG